LPQIVSTVLKIADDPDASARAMERVVERDSAITAKILKVANSPFYGLQQVPSIGRAISVLGLNNVRSLVINVAYQQMISGRVHSKLFDKLSFWQHSLGVATACRILAKIKMPLKAEELYGAGIMHDVGMLVLARYSPEEFDSAISISNEKRIPLHLAETQVFGFDHCVVGGLLAEQWRLSPILYSAIRHHHNVFQEPDQQETTSIVAAADWIAHEAGLRNNGGGYQAEMDAVAEMTLDLPREQYAVIVRVVQEEVSKVRQSMQI
jgi:HD-like signal output (HDOD) protein